jgi:hypothetical protein
MKNGKLFSAINKRYFASEIVSYVLAAAMASLTAVITDSFTDSDIIISVVSTLGGSVGFFAGGMGSYAILNIAEYKSHNRSFSFDMKAMFISDIHGVWVTYIFRIPLQYIMQKFGVAPAIAAPIAQIAAGQVGTVARVYSNYKKKIFGADAQNDED